MSISNKIAPGARVGRSYQAMTTMSAIAPLPSNPNDQTIIGRIISQYKNLTRKQIDQWRIALRAATDPYNPRPYLLQDICWDLQTDGHYKSQVGLRNMATLGHPFQIDTDATGEVDPVTTKLFRASWFYDFMEMALTYFELGYTALELINPVTMEFDIIPRRNVLPKRKIVVLQVMDTDGIYYGEGFEDRIIEIGKTDYLGYMNDIIPQLIWKRNSQQSWAEFSEKFGMPLITATSSKTNKADLDKLETLLEALGEAARAVLPEGTTIDIKQFSGKDSFQVYDMQINRCNSEISKRIVGGTMTSDDGSSRSQSEVHERNLDDKIAQGDRTKMKFLVNDKLIPLLRSWGWPIPEGVTFNYPASFDIDLLDHWTIVAGILLNYDIPMEWISKTFNVPIDKVKDIVPEPKPPIPIKPKAKATKRPGSFFD